MYSKNVFFPFTKTGLIVLALMFAPVSMAEMVVVVHPDNPMTEISSSQLRSYFLGKKKEFPDGKKVKTYELVSGEAREVFLNEVVRKKESSYQSYWARMIFSNKAAPPEPVKTPQSMKQQVASDVGGIGFMDSSEVDDSVKVLTVY